jgi:low temperature requirement protein LtrA
MTSLRKNFRRWWQPPRKTSEREEERSVTFLELFYDLVYVVLVAEIAHALSTHVDWEGVISFAAMFALVWLAWINGTLYHDLHGNNDIRTRVFTFLQMFTVAAMAVFAHDALGESSVGFALSFAAYQIILTYLWWRTGMHDPDHRPLSQPYALAFLVSTLLFAGSVFVPVPWRFYLWAVALLISLLLPLINLVIRPNDPRVQAELERTMTVTPSAVERFGLFAIIVLGEVIVAVVRGVAGHHHLTWTVGVIAALGMLIAIGLWWLYFDFISQHTPKSGRSKVVTWMYLHLFMTMGIVATGAATLNVVEHAGEHLPAEVRWLLVGAISLTLATIALLMRIIQIPDEHFRVYRTAGIVTFVSSIIILLLGFSGLTAIPLLIILILLMLAPVFYGLKVWIQMLGAEEITIT